MKMLDPITVGKLQLKNRIMFPPLTTGYEEKGGIITDKSINFYRTLAKGGAGLITIGDVGAVRAFSKTPTLHDDTLIAYHQKLTDAVHKEGAKVSAQIYYPEVDPDIIIKAMKEKGMPQAMKLYHELFNDYVNQVDKSAIDKIQNLIVTTAIRAKKAGYDMLQIHGDRLIGMFCSPILNKRTDEYGGSFENRARFALEVVDKIRKALPDMPLDYKLSIIRMNPRIGKGGPTLEEAKILTKWLEEKGIDSLHVCIANHGSVIDTIPAMGMQPYACFLDLAKEIKKVASIPVSTVGRIIKPEMVEDILNNGDADMVALGRQLLADPEWVNKVKEGKENEIRYCIMCNKGCTDNLTSQKDIACVINPAHGLDETPVIRKAESTKNILVIGAGPAGLEFARTAAIRGHKVTIFEKDNRLFGQLNIASVPPHKDEMIRLLEFYEQEMNRLQINIEFNKEGTIENIRQFNADEVVIATGAIPLLPKFKGIDNQKTVTSWDVLDNKTQLQGKVAIIGGGSVGVETAEFIGNKGHETIIVEMLDEIAQDEGSMKILIEKTLKENKTEIYTGHSLYEITEKGIIIKDSSDEEKNIDCDMVVCAIGARPNNMLAEQLKNSNVNFHEIGDCKFDKVRLISDAVRDGFNLALEM